MFVFSDCFHDPKKNRIIEHRAIASLWGWILRLYTCEPLLNRLSHCTQVCFHDAHEGYAKRVKQWRFVRSLESNSTPSTAKFLCAIRLHWGFGFWSLIFLQVHPKALSMTDSSGWKLIKLRTSVPIRCRGRRRCSVGLKLESHSRFVTDRCRMMLTERNRKNYGFYVKPVRDFRKLKRQNIRIHFSPIRSTPGLCGFWKGYRLPPIKVNNVLTWLLSVYMYILLEIH